VGLVFFTLVLFAALTSSISMTETCVASVCDFLKLGRKPSTLTVTVWSLALGSVSAFGYGPWSSFRPCGMPPLEFFDFAMNSVLMPVVAVLTCIFVGWKFTPARVLDECGIGRNSAFGGFYSAMVRYLAPVLVMSIFVSEICRAFGIGGWSI
jgi:NSS family neurotransmitter:Na+ symporter